MKPAQYAITRAARSGYLLCFTAVQVRSNVALVATRSPRLIPVYKKY